MPTADACKREIEGLHECFVRWYRGECDRPRFERVEAALAPSFERITPGGSVHEREVVLDGIESAYGSYDGETCEITIRNVTPVEIREDRALVRYEEWQRMGEDRTGRLSTVLFGAIDDASASGAHTTTATGLEWLHLQETWLDSGE
jgi:hypothetical protein